MTSKKMESDFESSLEKLEEFTQKLKSDDISLEESILVYEKCIMYHKRCTEILENAKQRVEIYQPKTGKTEDFGELI